MKLNWLKHMRLLPVLMFALVVFVIFNGDVEAQTKGDAQISAPVVKTTGTDVTPASSVSDAKPTTKKAIPIFDHSRFGFPLEGAHEHLKCEECHVKGTFKNTPNTCVACHQANNQIGAVQEPPNHIQTTTRCDSCHTVINFSGIRTVDHKEVLGACSSCHNGIMAAGKSANHVPTTSECNVCHNSTYSWSAATFSHQGIVDNCARCHNGINAEGKTPWHFSTTQDCSACHVTTSWITATYDHTGITTGCFNCHNGNFAKGKGHAHINTSNTCESCHTPGPLNGGSPDVVGWNTPILPMPHGNQVGGTCASCHSPTGNSTLDGYLVEGVITGTHIPLTGTDCSKCHTTNVWNPAIIAPMDHTQVSTTCTLCHKASGGDSTQYSNITIDGVNGSLGTHIPLTGSAVCSNCHTTAAWNPYLSSPMDHTYVVGVCSSCHDPSASYTNVTLDSKTTGAGAPPLVHVTTSAQCNTCHTTTTNWKTANYDHTGIVSGCYNCHNSSNALASSKKASHMATTNVCESCHTVGTLGAGGIPASNGWLTPILPIPHSQIPSTTCTNCHSSSGDQIIDAYKVHGVGGSLGTHIPLTGTDCTKCHSSAAANWNASMSVALPVMDHTLVSTTCSTCHNASGGDKATYAFVTVDGVNGTQVPGPHIPLTGTDCSKCHVYTASGWASSMAASLPVMDHTQVSTTCTACHLANGGDNTTYPHVTIDGVNGTQVPGPHIPLIATDCTKCHIYSAAGWPSALKVALPAMDHSEVSTTCTTCHNGSNSAFPNVTVDTKTGGPNFVNGFVHPTTALECSSCHKTTTSWSAGAYNHTGITTGCYACHNNGANPLAKGQSASHMPSSTVCESCHTTGVLDINGYPASTGWNTPILPIPHGQFTVTTCTTCHLATGDHNIDGYLVHGVGGALGTHIPLTGTDCTKCHSSAAANWNASMSVALPAMDHSLVSTTCSTCHNASGGDKTTYSFVTVDGLNGTRVPGPHIPISGTDCSKCHIYTASDWVGSMKVALPAMDHTQVSTTCTGCHLSSGGDTTTYPHVTIDGVNGTQVPGPHIPLVATDCTKCHIYTPSGWVASMAQTLPAMDHSEVSTTCTTCHNGSNSAFPNVTVDTKTGGPNFVNGFVHVSTALECSSCHKVTTSWTTASFDHTGTTTGCFNCHNGSSSQAAGKGSAHMAATNVCESCHTTGTLGTGGTPPSNGWLTPILPIPHGQFTVVTCSNCHLATGDQTIDGYKVHGAVGGSLGTHIPFTGTDCTKCHTSAGATWAASMLTALPAMDHSVVSTTCTTCHNSSGGDNAHYTNVTIDGVNGTQVPGPHIPITGTDCTKCHIYTASGWVASMSAVLPIMDHTQVSTTCSTCHNSTGGDSTTYPHVTIDGVNGTQTPGPHIPITGTDCTKCHIYTASGWVSSMKVALPAMDHSIVSTTCSTCHNSSGGDKTTYPHVTIDGVNGTQVPGPHIPLVATDCTKCHIYTASGWPSSMVQTLPSMDHSQLTTACTTCHNGSNSAYTNVTVDTKTGGPNFTSGFVHPTTSLECSQCHTTTTSWQTASYNHTGITSGCYSCHNSGNSLAKFKGGSHMASTNVCESCHTTGALDANGNPAATGWNTPIIPIPHGQFTVTTCTTCHLATGDQTIDGYLVHGAGGVLGKHIPLTATDCTKCHTSAGATWPTSMLVALPVMDHTEVSTTCNSCHLTTGNSTAYPNVTIDGAVTGTHIPLTGNNCAACHVYTASGWVSSMKVALPSMDHTQVTTTCTTCHGGTTNAYPNVTVDTKTGGPNFPGGFTHPTTTLECTSCHIAGGTTSWLSAIFIHDSTDSNCVSCHIAGNTFGADTYTTYLGAGFTHMPLASASTQCSDCHVYTSNSWSLTNAASFKHSDAQAPSSCNTCHGSTTYPGGMAIDTQTTFAGAAYSHMQTNTNCQDCHVYTSNSWTLTNNASFNHNDATNVNTCYTCHGGTTYAGGMVIDTKTKLNGAAITHMNTSNNCNLCHAYSSGVWTLSSAAAFTHSEATAPNSCSTCHTDATAASFTHTISIDTQTKFGGTAYTHMATNTNCQDCHTYAGSVWTLASNASFNHSDATNITSCVACHGTTTFAGGMAIDSTTKINGGNYTHVPVSASAALCANCHSGSNFTNWNLAVTNAIDHTQLTSYTTCNTCHLPTPGALNTTYTNISIQGEGAAHMSVTGQCSDCHILTAWTLSSTAFFNHHDTAAVCTVCHDAGTTIDGETMDTKASGPNNTLNGGHIATSNPCDSCHTAALAFAGGYGGLTGGTPTWANAIGGTDHTKLTTASDCTVTGCHTVGNASGAIGYVSGQHIPLLTGVGAGLCQTCHNLPTTANPSPQANSAWISLYKGTMVGFHTKVPTTCTTCHLTTGNNTTYPGVTIEGYLAGTHYPLSTDLNNCAYCHNATDASFVNAKGYDHRNETTTTCALCHVTTGGGSFTVATGIKRISLSHHGWNTLSGGTTCTGNGNCGTSQTVCGDCHGTHPGCTFPFANGVICPSGSSCNGCSLNSN